jgi:two-component system OmpR family sensor kinase
VLRSLRFRLPALFLAGVVVAGLVAAAIAFRLLQDYTLSRARAELNREAVGLTKLYRKQATRSNDIPPATELEEATGDRLYYVPAAQGLSIFPGQRASLRLLPTDTVDLQAVRRARSIRFEFRPPDRQGTYLAVAKPLYLGQQFYGALVVAKPKDELQTRLVPLIQRLALALIGGIAVAGALAWYLSRRITKPVLALSRAADEVAEGRYGVAVPTVPGGDEIGHLAERFRQMAVQLSEAEQQERNFLMSVSHELRTPLTAIRGHVEALREGVADDPNARAASLDVIAVEASRLERLVGDILDLAKLEANRFTVLREEVDMETLCEQAYATFGEEARRREIAYEHEVSARPVIVTDGDRVLQIITNLRSNAFRWTPDGGRIELDLRAANGTVAVGVEDTGPGIRAEEAERIFRPFYTRDGGGTGLGLAIANELAEALGGRIKLTTQPGKGSRFELLLPARLA